LVHAREAQQKLNVSEILMCPRRVILYGVDLHGRQVFGPRDWNIETFELESGIRFGKKPPAGFPGNIDEINPAVRSILVEVTGITGRAVNGFIAEGLKKPDKPVLRCCIGREVKVLRGAAKSVCVEAKGVNQGKGAAFGVKEIGYSPQDPWEIHFFLLLRPMIRQRVGNGKAAVPRTPTWISRLIAVLVMPVTHGQLKVSS
jgi:hypothetical protein